MEVSALGVHFQQVVALFQERRVQQFEERREAHDGNVRDPLVVVAPELIVRVRGKDGAAGRAGREVERADGVRLRDRRGDDEPPALNAASAPEALDKANADPEALEALRAGARQVDDEHVCASCLADYFRRVFAAIRERVSYHLVLDDPSSVLRLAESEGACDAFYEAVVVRRVEAEGVYHDRVRRGCNLCAALRGEVCRVEGVN